MAQLPPTSCFLFILDLMPCRIKEQADTLLVTAACLTLPG